MVVRVGHYIYNFYMRLIESKQKLDKLPPVFPIVLYNGLDKWTAPTDIAELIENNQLLGDFSLTLKYFKLAENEISVDRLLAVGNAVSTLFIGEVHDDRQVLFNEFSKLLKLEDQMVLSLLFNYFEQLFNHDKMDEVDWNALDKVRNREEINMFLENMKACDKFTYQRGWKEGKQ